MSTLFAQNKYYQTYFKLVELARSQNRVKSKSEYFENHHIIPKSLGGKDSRENRVLLTAREHFIAHRLLTKMVTEKSDVYKMVCALWYMASNPNAPGDVLTSWQYEIARKAFAHEVSKQNLGRPKSEKTKARMREKKLTDEHRLRISEAAKARWSRSDSDKDREIIIARNKASKLISDSHRQSMSVSGKNAWSGPAGDLRRQKLIERNKARKRS